MEKKITKKEMILDAALTLFSQKGYDGVGVDEIADAVGMKGPALYHYFRGKEAILNALMETMNAYYNERFGNIEHITVYPESLEQFMEITLKRLEFSIHDPQIKKVRRMLAMEQFRNETLRAATTEHHVTGLEKLNAFLLQKLIENGKVKPYDAEMLSFELTSPVTMMVHLIDREPDKEEWAMDRIKKHLAHFVEVYGINE